MQTITIGLLGLGTVGGGVVKLLQEHAAKIEQTTNVHFVLKRVAVAHLDKPRNVTLPDDTILTDQLDEVLNDPEIQVIVETMGDYQPCSSGNYSGNLQPQIRNHCQQGSLGNRWPAPCPAC